MKHVMITGGGSGLGLGMAQRYLKRGVTVSVLDLLVNEENQAKLSKAAAEGKAQWAFFEMNITDDAAVAQAVAEAISQFGSPDLAVNSAGVVINKTVADMTPADFRRVIDINLNGSLHFASAVLPQMKKGARLALVASLAGITSNYGYSAYAASKFGVVGLATALRYEYEPLGIHLSCICPPEVHTPMVDKERLEGNPISLELKKTAGCMDSEDACDQIVAGLDGRQWMIIPSFTGKLTGFVARHMPGAFNAYIQMTVKKLLKQYPIEA
ncbi:SDR family NAD(P)-dependent oxidoreductase [Marinobacter mobilis]|uniref:NAD(P)-dependent dehydrogenase, short-chain alcohol dehydrogenase family n=1 Tax=Marinobacter mobilis TaxID=488533 RepID=A0A1H2S885_9GAMM|nr:SDR family NAD(P)-dependent oxidoreductase [Marinobacter mobilis]SDW27715.1 NAD(P)-dependent dehydrogenase, short-chain alcohol dehydrogenase family [Marinobacter mobilis]